MEKLQILGRVLYRATVISMVCLIHSPTAYYGIPLGLIIGLLSEAKNITDERKG